MSRIYCVKEKFLIKENKCVFYEISFSVFYFDTVGLEALIKGLRLRNQIFFFKYQKISLNCSVYSLY